MLRVTLVGNMGGDPEARYTSKGTQMVTFTVAVNQVRTGTDGERQENTHWFRVRGVGTRFDYVSRLTKGTRVLVVGRLDIGQYQSKQGDTRTSFDVWADEIVSMAPRAQGAAEGGFEADADVEPEPEPRGVSSVARAGAASGSNGKSKRSEELEDLPF